MKYFFALLTIWSLSACNEVDKTEAKVPEQVLQNMGSTYELRSVRWTNGNVTNPPIGSFRLKLSDENTLTGNIQCNDFFAEVSWSEEGFITFYNFEKSRKRCDRADPLVLDSKMKYSFNNNELILISQDGSWRAILQRLND